MRAVELVLILSSAFVWSACNRHNANGDGGTGSGTEETGTTSTESGESGDTTGSSECEFPGPGGSCSIWCQDCGAGEKCVPVLGDGGFDETRCVEVSSSPNAPEQACSGDAVSGLDDCDANSVCWDIEPDTQTGTCRPLCAGSPAEPGCPGASRCFQWEGWDAVAVCLDNCDPLTNPACTSGRRCVPQDPLCDPIACLPMGSGGGLFCVAVPSQPLYKGMGEPCGIEDECDWGLLCAPASKVSGCAGDGGCCTPYCDLDAPECADGTCKPMFEAGAAPAGLEHLGACLSG